MQLEAKWKKQPKARVKVDFLATKSRANEASRTAIPEVKTLEITVINFHLQKFELPYDLQSKPKINTDITGEGGFLFHDYIFTVLENSYTDENDILNLKAVF